MANNQQWSNNSASPLTIGGNISAAGSLTTIGSGVVALTAATTLGGLTVDGGTLQAAGGSLSAASNEYIGYAGTGTFVQPGGSNSLSYLYMGYQNGSVGTYNLSGSVSFPLPTSPSATRESATSPNRAEPIPFLPICMSVAPAAMEPTA